MKITEFPAIIKRYEATAQDEPKARFKATITMLDALVKFCRAGGLLERGTVARDVDHWYTRAAAALTQYITDEQTKITVDGMFQLCARKAAISYIFSASGYRGMRHLATQMWTEEENGSFTLDSTRAAVLLGFLSLDDVSKELMTVAFRQPPNILLSLTLGWLNQRAVLTDQGERNRSLLLTNGHLLEKAEIEDKHIGLLVNAWMYSSYASHSQKHDIKVWFNKLLLQRMERAGIKPRAPERRLIERPKLLVIHERFTTGHAMVRSFKKILGRLSDRFEISALADESCIDDGTASIFSKVIKLPTKRPSISKIVDQITDLAPDMIFYPSLGMSHWTVMLSLLRLAPIQVASLGHPATTRSEAIDYIYTAEMDGDLTKIFSERILVGQKAGVYTKHPDLENNLPQLQPPSAREVRIAINSKVMKLSHRLLDICEKLEANSSKTLHFVFLPGEAGLYLDGLTAAIKRRLPNATVCKNTNYRQFLETIATCDISLAAFPFGNTNSTVDTCLLGLPTVALFGPEPPAQTDKKVIAAAGLPNWTVCDTDEAYYDTALHLIEHDDARGAAVELERGEAVLTNLFPANVVKDETMLRDCLWSTYCCHEQLMQEEQRVFTRDELLNCEATIATLVE